MAKAQKQKAPAGTAKKKTPIWYAVAILVVICVGIIGAGVSIYWETLFPESHKKMRQAVGDAASRAVATAESRFSDLLAKASRYDFEARGLPLCREAESQATTPKGWHYRELTGVLGLPDHPNRAAVLARCQAFAEAIHAMQDMSGPKAVYEVICADSGTHFEIDTRRGMSIFPRRDGVRQTVASTQPAFIPVRAGKTKLVQRWQVHGLGGGCYVVGSDKLSMFQRSGEVKKDAAE